MRNSYIICTLLLFLIFEPTLSLKHKAKTTGPKYDKFLGMIEAFFEQILKFLQNLFLPKNLIGLEERETSLETLRMLRYLILFFFVAAMGFVAVIVIVKPQKYDPVLVLTVSMVGVVLLVILVQYLQAFFQRNRILESLLFGRKAYKAPGPVWITCIVIASFLLPIIEAIRKTHPNSSAMFNYMRIGFSAGLCVVFSLTALLSVEQFRDWHFFFAFLTIMFLCAYLVLLFYTLTNLTLNLAVVLPAGLLLAEFIAGYIARKSFYYSTLELIVLFTGFLFIGLALIFPLDAPALQIPPIPKFPPLAGILGVAFGDFFGYLQSYTGEIKPPTLPKLPTKSDLSDAITPGATSAVKAVEGIIPKNSMKMLYNFVDRNNVNLVNRNGLLGMNYVANKNDNTIFNNNNNINNSNNNNINSINNMNRNINNINSNNNNNNNNADYTPSLVDVNIEQLMQMSYPQNKMSIPLPNGNA